MKLGAGVQCLLSIACHALFSCSGFVTKSTFRTPLLHGEEAPAPKAQQQRDALAAQGPPVIVTETLRQGALVAPRGGLAEGVRALAEVGDLRDLTASAEQWRGAALAAEARAVQGGDARTALVSRRAVEAVTRDMEAVRSGRLHLYNPSLVELPLGWRRPGEKWLAVFRQQTTSNSSKEPIPVWYSSSVVLAVLSDKLRPMRPLRVLTSRDFFPDAFDCTLRNAGNHTYFGPEDARLFAHPATKLPMLFFTGRAHSQRPNVPCAERGGQRMYMAPLDADLRPHGAHVILVLGERGPAQAVQLNSFPDAEAAPIAGRLGRVEKNWSPFVHEGKVFLEYEVEPHVVMGLDLAGHVAGAEGLWRASSPLFKAWLRARQRSSGETLTAHGGVGPVLLEGLLGQESAFLSILHTRDNVNFVYRSYFYIFHAQPPFALLGVGDRELPLVRQNCSWGARVAFATSITRVEGLHSPEVWVMYGSGDRESRRLVLPWAELRAFLPNRFVLDKEVRKESIADREEGHSSPMLGSPTAEVEAEVVDSPINSGSIRGANAPLISTMQYSAQGQELRQVSYGLRVVKHLLPRAKLILLENEAHSWDSKAARERAQALRWKDQRTAEISYDMQLAAESELHALSVDEALSGFFNPSLVEMPATWRRQGDKWLAIFRQALTSNQTNQQRDATWHSFSLVLTVLDAELKPVRSAEVLNSQNIFPGTFDCQLSVEETSYFGPSDAHVLFADPPIASEAFLLFTSRVQAEKPNTPCPDMGGQRMFLAKVDRDLHVSMPEPILIPGEDAPIASPRTGRRQDNRVVTASVTANAGVIPGVGQLKPVEKNWSPFFYQPMRIFNSSGVKQVGWGRKQALMEYSVEPHVVLDLDLQNHRMGQHHVWKSSSSVLKSWLARRAAEASPSQTVTSDDIHGGVPPILLEAWPGRPKVFLSALHTRLLYSSGSVVYKTYLYTFMPEPPFQILGVSERELPLNKHNSSWGASVAFAMNLIMTKTSYGEEFWLLYGCGDEEADRLVIPRQDLGNFLPLLPAGPPALTLVIMCHSRERLADTKHILAHYRAMDASNLLAQILVIWNDPADPTTAAELRQVGEGDGVPLVVIEAELNSMNNRFAVWEAVATEGVIIQDDDMWLDAANLGDLVAAWRAAPDKLIGAFNERDHFSRDAAGHLNELAPKCQQSQYIDGHGKDRWGTDTSCTFWGEEYSMLLPHPWVLSRKYLQMYMQNREATQLVDSMLNCDDIYLNSVVANYTRMPPIALEVKVHRFPTWMAAGAMWVRDKNWTHHRTHCLEVVASYYKSEPLSPDTGTVFRLALHSASLARPGQMPALAIPAHPHWWLAVSLGTAIMLMWLRTIIWNSVLGVVVSWSCASIMMNIVNKRAAVVFPTCLLVILQMLIGSVVIFIAKRAEMSFGKWQDVVRWMAIPFIFAGMLTTSLCALKETTLSTVLILRNTLPFMTFAAEKTLFGEPREVTGQLLLSLCITLVGTVLYGWSNLSVTRHSAGLIALNCILTVIDKLLQRHMLASDTFTVSMPLCALINNTVGILPMLVIAALTGEVQVWHATILQASPSTWMLVGMSGGLGYCLSFLGLRLQKLVTATMVLVLQNFSKILTISIGVVVFKEWISGISAAGCILAMVGAACYSYLQLPTSLSLLPLPGGDGIRRKK